MFACHFKLFAHINHRERPCISLFDFTVFLRQKFIYKLAWIFRAYLGRFLWSETMLLHKPGNERTEGIKVGEPRNAFLLFFHRVRCMVRSQIIYLSALEHLDQPQAVHSRLPDRRINLEFYPAGRLDHRLIEIEMMWSHLEDHIHPAIFCIDYLLLSFESGNMANLSLQFIFFY